MATTLRSIKQSQVDMKQHDNAWAEKYVRDVGWLLNRLAEVRETLARLQTSRDCWCVATWKGAHDGRCQRTSILYEKLRTDK